MGFCLTQAFIFDFDGTLVDSEQAIYHCFQSITKKIAPKRIEYAKNILIGPPLRDTASEILGPEHQDSLDQFVQLFIKMHDEEALNLTNPYPNVIETLNFLYKNKIPMALATNKRRAPTDIILKSLGWNKFFEIIKCSDDEMTKNKTDSISKIIMENELFKDSFYVGDTEGDSLSANENMLNFIKANYGYGREQEWLDHKIYAEINCISELKLFLK